MRTTRLAWIVGSPLVVAAAALWTLGGCSDNASPTNATTSAPGVDSGGRPVTSPDSGSPVEPVSDAGSDCGKAAKLFPPKPDGGMFCPFSATDGGKDTYCALTDTCCETPQGTSPSTCVSGKTDACPIAKSVPWQCESPADCPNGEVCCAHSGDAGTVSVGSDVCGPYLSKFGGTRCAATCAAGELVVCEEQADCTTGTCTAVKPKGNDIGVCN